MKEREVKQGGLLSRIFGRRSLEPNKGGSVTNLWGLSGSGTLVSVEEALKIPAVLACVRVISDTVGMLPFKLFYNYQGKFRPAYERSEYDMLSDNPNEYQTSDQFRQAMTASCLLKGSAIAEKEKSLAGSTIALHFIQPDRLSNVFIGSDGRIRYVVDGKEFTRDTIFHIPGPTLNGDGLRGDSLVARAAEAIGLAIAQQQYAGAYYANGATPATIISHPKSLSEPAAKRIEASFRENFRGARQKHKFALLEEGMEIKQVGSNADDAQLVDARRAQVIEVCRVFGIQPHLVQELERATFSNIEEQAREFIEYTMMPWFIRWEKNAAKQLLTAEERRFYYWKFNVDALMRGKTLDRFQAYQVAIQNGIYSPNEARAKEDANPYDGGDMHLIPLNMQEVGKK